MPTITVVGSANVDMIVKVPRLPRPGETVLGGPFATAAGGKGANQAVAAARLGAQVNLVARVGSDMFGEQAFRGYQDEGIHIEGVVKDPDVATGVCLIMVDAVGQNCLAAAVGANDRLSPADVVRAEALIADSSILLLQLENPVETVRAAAEMGYRHGIPVILNPAPARAATLEFLPLVHVLTPNETEASALTGIVSFDDAGLHAMADALLQQGPKAVIITLGARGALVATPEQIVHLTAYPVQAVDATAAGDAFNGAFAVALARGVPLIEAAQFASAVAALSVTRLGAQPSLPYAMEVERFLELHPAPAIRPV